MTDVFMELMECIAVILGIKQKDDLSKLRL